MKILYISLNSFYEFQIASVEAHFDYKMDHYRNWFYCVLAMVMTLLCVGLSTISYTLYEVDYSVSCLIDFYLGSLLQCTAATAPLLFYIILLSNLQKRFAMLNSLLRSLESFSKSALLIYSFLMFHLFQIEIDFRLVVR